VTRAAGAAPLARAVLAALVVASVAAFFYAGVLKRETPLLIWPNPGIDAFAPAGGSTLDRAAHFRLKASVGDVLDVRVLSSAGRLVAGTSTGGTLYKYPGRVGDSPIIGAGCYADATAGGASSTGEGEAILRITMAKTAVELLRSGESAPAAARAALDILARRGRGTGGIILLDKTGTPGFAHTTPRMAHGFVAEGGEIVVPDL